MHPNEFGDPLTFSIDESGEVQEVVKLTLLQWRLCAVSVYDVNPFLFFTYLSYFLLLTVMFRKSGTTCAVAPTVAANFNESCGMAAALPSVGLTVTGQ